MSGAIWGADVGQMDAVARLFNSNADKLALSETHITEALSAVDWIGEDADFFRLVWQATHRKHLLTMVDALQDAGRHMFEQADQQRAASDHGDGAPSTPGVWALAGTATQATAFAASDGPIVRDTMARIPPWMIFRWWLKRLIDAIDKWWPPFLPPPWWPPISRPPVIRPPFWWPIIPPPRWWYPPICPVPPGLPLPIVPPVLRPPRFAPLPIVTPRPPLRWLPPAIPAVPMKFETMPDEVVGGGLGASAHVGLDGNAGAFGPAAFGVTAAGVGEAIARIAPESPTEIPANPSITADRFWDRRWRWEPPIITLPWLPRPPMVLGPWPVPPPWMPLPLPLPPLPIPPPSGWSPPLRPPAHWEPIFPIMPTPRPLPITPMPILPGPAPVMPLPIEPPRFEPMPLPIAIDLGAPLVGSDRDVMTGVGELDGEGGPAPSGWTDNIDLSLRIA